jgi:shikimate dehydrogenase
MSVFGWREAPRADFAVLGHPIKHSLSPKMHHAAYDALGRGEKYVAIEVIAEEFGQAINHLIQLGYRGVNVTIPHKTAAFEWADSTCETSQKLQVCNTLRFSDRSGVNTDVPGFLKSLPGHSQRALVLGAGGSARAIVYALSRQGTEVSVWNRTESRAVELVDQIGLGSRIVSDPAVGGFGLIVNTTSTGLTGDSLPIDWTGAEPGSQLAYDLAYSSGPTSFLSEAASHGLTGMDGRMMLMEQGAFAFEYWFDVSAPREAMWEAIR